MEEIIKIITSIVAICFTIVMGGWDFAAQILIVLMIIDYVTGIIRSAKIGGLSSETGFRGILKKILMLCVVMVGVMIDGGMNMGGVIRAMVIWYYIANEALSIIENVGEMGVPVPRKLQQMIENLRKENDEDQGSEDQSSN